MTGNGRLQSLDALRGFDMLWILGLASVILTVCGLFPGGTESWLYAQLHHAKGVGFTFYDLVFPLFLFMAGVSWSFSYASQLRKGLSSSRIHLRILKRVLLLAALQMVQSGALWFDPAHYFYPSVLIRIAFSWALAALVYMWCPRKVGVAVAVLGVLGYWALLAFVPSPLLPAGQPFDYGDWTTSHVAWANRYLSFRAWFGRDPFEVMDIPLAIVQVPLALCGMFAGDILRREAWSPTRRAGALAAIGAVLTITGILFVALGCPLSKQLSTASFMLLTGGLCNLLLAGFFYVIDVRGLIVWSRPLQVIGQNSIVAYLLPGLVCFFPACPLVAAIGKLAFCWFVLWLLARAKVFVKV